MMNLHIAHATIHIGMPLDGTPGEFVTGFVDSTSTPSGMPPTMITPAAGEYWTGQGGRFICTLPALMGMRARALIAADGEKSGLIYGPDMDVPGATSQIDGAANTAALLATGKDHPAAKWASEYTADGHTDFFLPARLDLLMAYICAPQLFQKAGWYITSTQGSSYGAFAQYFECGSSYWGDKDIQRLVRPFRVIQL